VLPGCASGLEGRDEAAWQKPEFEFYRKTRLIEGNLLIVLPRAGDKMFPAGHNLKREDLAEPSVEPIPARQATESKAKQQSGSSKPLPLLAPEIG
jgi:hypothetical protein